jgi:hypothetical protein
MLQHRPFLALPFEKPPCVMSIDVIRVLCVPYRVVQARKFGDIAVRCLADSRY